MTGFYRMPEHYLSYEIQFKLENGDIIDLAFSKEIYDGISVGLQDVLVTQAQNFLGFGNYGTYDK